ncbi:unnamed protein product (macronuclear) [Paramecium tetraurelia]|uniref:Uncharacterized protein n=1 Tax=Paramecium tetraurelia TaxID=5888 RepID=A0ED99_PARTE|nr:uncharacterized protein GSPATT00004135001 [Paramecium tetraurelia]CAK93266.1 unnamed protein product [Paramecium tetraurelia]|eukprot:XP_001460663.1 hypothetical protein (macronuclear) [Paramecium tetraurelia strain d4-2]
MGCSVTKTKVNENLKTNTTDKFESYLITQSLVQTPPVPIKKQYSIEKNPIIQRRRLKSQQKTRTTSVIDKQDCSV